MKLPDTHVLVNSVNEASPYLQQAVQWLEQAFGSGIGVGFAWLAHPCAKILHPTARHTDILAKLLLMAGAAGHLTHEAHLATLAIEHGTTIGTFDQDFKKFPGVTFDLLKQC